MEWFQNLELWQVIIGIFGIIVPISLVLWERGRNRKRFGYVIESVSPLFSRAVKQLGELEVIYNKRPVSDPYLTVISFYNLGRQPISSSDYEQPLIISIESTEVLSVTTTKTTPPNLEVNASVESDEIDIAPFLLNSGDSITLSLITEGEGNISVKARLIGVSEIEQRTSISDNSSIFKALLLFVLTVSIVTVVGGLAVSEYFTNTNSLNISNMPLTESTMIILLLTLVVGLLFLILITQLFRRVLNF